MDRAVRSQEERALDGIRRCSKWGGSWVMAHEDRAARPPEGIVSERRRWATTRSSGATGIEIGIWGAVLGGNRSRKRRVDGGRWGRDRRCIGPTM